MNDRPTVTSETAGKLGSSTATVPATTDAASYCPHGVTRGARCRHCLTGHGTGPAAPPPAATPTGRRAGYVPIESLRARQIGAHALPTVKAAILELLTERPMTDDELHAAYLDAGHPRRSRQRVGTARAELAKTCHVHETGERRASAMGNPARVWTATA